MSIPYTDTLELLPASIGSVRRMRGLIVFGLGIFLALGEGFSQGLIFYEDFDNWETNPPCPEGWSCSTSDNCLPASFCFWNRQDAFVALGRPDSVDCDNSGNYARCNTTQLQFGQVITMTSPVLDLSQNIPDDSLVVDFCYINSSVIPIDEDGIRVSFSADSGATWFQQFEDNSRNYSSWNLISLPISNSFFSNGFQIRFEGFSGNSTGDIGIDGLVVANVSNNCGLSEFNINVGGSTSICKDEVADTLFFQSQAQNTPGAELTYAITDEADTLLFLFQDSLFDFNLLPLGTYTIRGILHIGFLDAPIGSLLTELSSSRCLELSQNTLQISVGELLLNAVIASPFGQSVSCRGANDARINLELSGGQGPYTYQWSNGSDASFLNEIGAGTYSVEVRDQAQCLARDTVTVLEPEQLTAEIAILSDFEGQAISCFDASDGSLTAISEGGTAPYNYLWSNGATNDSLFDLAARQYIVFVTDSNGCVALDSVELENPDPLEVETEVISDFNGDDISAPDATDGQARATATGGTPPYTFQWNSLPPQNSQVAVGLGAGVYTVLVTDRNGCESPQDILIRSPGTLSASLEVLSDYSGNPISCPGAEDAALAVKVNGGVPPYTIIWEDFPEYENQDTVIQIGAGTYRILVQDAEETEARVSITLTNPDTLLVEAIIENPVCLDQNSGKASLRVSGGSSGYLYEWSTGSLDSSITNLSAGKYLYTVSDSNGCTFTDSIELVAGSTFEVTIEVGDESCPGSNDGSIVVVPENGIPPYSYLWSTGDTASSLLNLGTGIYSVQIADSSGCSRSDTLQIQVGDSLKVAVEVTGDLGPGTGTATALVEGGTPPFAYEWSSSDTDTTFQVSDLATGDYSLQVIDSAGCFDIVLFEIPLEGGQCPALHMGFTPNGDGVNDTWHIPCINQLGDHTISIFGRWGQTLIEFVNYDNSWEGVIDGSPLPAGSYFYLIRSQNTPQVYKGTLTLIR